MASTAIGVKGFAELERELKTFAERFQLRSLNLATAASARAIAKEAKALAPERTGAIKRNIRIKRLKPRKVSTYYIVGVDHGAVPILNEGAAVYFDKYKKRMVTRRATKRELRGEDPYYYQWQEQGFHAVGRSSRKARKRSGNPGRWVEGKHFLRDSIAHAHGMAIDVMRAKLAAEIRKMRK
jgi:predicted ribosome-associated RNA-binding protein Tma20